MFLYLAALRGGRHMRILDYVIPSFVLGVTIGIVLASLYFKSKVKVYKTLAERRLAAVGQRLVDSQTSAKEGSPVR